MKHGSAEYANPWPLSKIVVAVVVVVVVVGAVVVVVVGAAAIAVNVIMSDGR